MYLVAYTFKFYNIFPNEIQTCKLVFFRRASFVIIIFTLVFVMCGVAAVANGLQNTFLTADFPFVLLVNPLV